MSGSLTSDTRDETVLANPEAASSASVMVSWTVEKTSFDFFLNSREHVASTHSHQHTKQHAIRIGFA